MKNIKSFSLLSFFCCILLFSCGKNSSKIYYFNETGCSNPWDSYYNADTFSLELLNQSITTFLSDENIEVNSVNFDFDSSLIEYCYACHCTTGRVIVADVSGVSRRKMKNLNFYQ